MRSARLILVVAASLSSQYHMFNCGSMNVEFSRLTTIDRKRLEWAGATDDGIDTFLFS